MGPSATLDFPTAAPTRSGSPRDRLAAHALAVEITRKHSDALLRTARRYAENLDDAHDAYQRALELLLEHAGTIDPHRAVGWMHVVVRREASALRRSHDRHVPLDVDELDRRQLSDRTDEHLHRIDLAQRAGEALATLKDTEAQALCLRAQGMSYEEIADANGWTYTKVNRAVSEGRKAFVEHYLGVESGAVCEQATEQLADYLSGTLRPRDRIRVRAHLTRCAACRARLHAERRADAALQALLPPAVLAMHQHGWLQDHLLIPLGDLVGRLTPVSDPALNVKVGTALSVVTLAGGGVTVERHLSRPPVPKLRAGFTSAPVSPPGVSRAQSSTTSVVLQTVAARGQQLAASDRHAKRAVRNKHTAKKHTASTTSRHVRTGSAARAEWPQHAPAPSTAPPVPRQLNTARTDGRSAAEREFEPTGR